MKKIDITKKEIYSIIIAIFIIFILSYGILQIKVVSLQKELINQNIIIFIFIISTILALILSIFILNCKKMTPEKAFLIVVPMFCIFMMIGIPMSKSHDESIHGQRIYEYAEGKFISDGTKTYVEEGVINALTDIQTYSSIFNSQKNYSTNTNKIEYGYRVATYSPINYFPHIIGIEIGRIVTNNSMIHLYLARLTNIIVCTVILYFAIKFIPFGKNLLLLLSIIPIAIEGFSTLSADGILISVSFLYIAYILKLREEKQTKINYKQIILLFTLAIIISLSKTVYITLLPLLFILPNEKFNNKKQKILIILFIIFIGIILDMLWYLFGIQKVNTTVISQESIKLTYIILNPIGYMERICYTIVTYSIRYIQEMFGMYLQWNETVKVNLFPIILFIFSIIISTAGKVETTKWTSKEKFWIYLVIVGSVLLIFTSIFLSWSSLNNAIIEGIQGRYFLPILPLVYLLFGKKFLEDKKTTKSITILGIILQIYTILEIILVNI